MQVWWSLWSIRDRGWSTSVDLSKGIVVCPFSLLIFLFFSFFYFFCIFWWPPWLFLFNLICPLWDLLNFFLFKIFSSLYGQHSIYYKKYKRSFTLYKRYSHKEDVTIMMQMYASASVAGYAIILVRHVAIIRARPN